MERSIPIAVMIALGAGVFAIFVRILYLIIKDCEETYFDDGTASRDQDTDR